MIKMNRLAMVVVSGDHSLVFEDKKSNVVVSTITNGAGKVVSGPFEFYADMDVRGSVRSRVKELESLSGEKVVQDVQRYFADWIANWTRELVVVEGVTGVYHYHLSTTGAESRALCGRPTMPSGTPLAYWGRTPKGHHIPESWCGKCIEALGSPDVRDLAIRAAEAGIEVGIDDVGTDGWRVIVETRSRR